jgi:hypothetical protein
VNTTAATALNQRKRFFGGSASGIALACILLVGIPARRRNWCAFLGTLLLLVAAAGSVLGCGGSGGGSGGGGGGGNPGTTPGTYFMTITGTAGSITHRGTVSLTVQ